MKLLIVTNFYEPGVKAGGPIKSIKNFVNNLSDKFEIYLVTLSSEFGEKKRYPNIEVDKWIKKDNINLLYVDKFNIKVMRNILDEIKPNVVYINSLFASSSISTYPLMSLNKNIKFIVSPRGELNLNALSIKRNKKKVFLFLMKYLKLLNNVEFHATSKGEFDDIKRIFNKNDVVIIPNLPAINNKEIIKNKKIKNHLKIVSISRVSKMKNIDYFLNILSEIKNGVIEYDIYGPIEDKSYYENCVKIIDQLEKNIKVNFKGSIENNLIPNILNKYDLFVSTTLGENFGHAIIEALQHQLPVLISNNTPWRTLENEKVGYDIDLKESKRFVEVVEKLVLLSDEEMNLKFNGHQNYLQKALDIEKIKNEYVKFIGGKNE